jgi:hypothetical protein
VVAISGNAVIIGEPLVFVGSRNGFSGDNAGENRETGGQPRHIAEGWRAGRAKTFIIVAQRVDALKGEDGEF